MFERVPDIVGRMIKRIFLTGAGIFALPLVAPAHTGAGSTHGFLAGLGHPAGGWDHLLAMVAIGLWASQLGGRSLWLVPLSFLGVMTFGGILGMAGVPVPYVEGGILISVIALGLLIAGGVRMPAMAGMILAGAFALFHGAAHGMEMPGGSSGALYASGFLVSTAALHAAGLGAGLMIGRTPFPVMTRACGLAVAAAGIFLAVS